MYLSNLEIDTKKSSVAHWLSNPYKIHQRLWMGFEHQKSEAIKPDFLFRIEESFKQNGEVKPRILVLSNVNPIWEHSFDRVEYLKKTPQVLTLNLDNFIRSERSFRFSLIANPTKKIKNYRRLFEKELKGFPAKESRDNREKYIEGKALLNELIIGVSKEQREKVPSKRIGIYKDYEKVEWLNRKGEQSGFQVLNMEFDKGENEKVTKKQDGSHNHELNLLQVHFTGILRVTDAEAFKRAYAQGIGSGKAFGCGMLLLARV